MGHIPLSHIPPPLTPWPHHPLLSIHLHPCTPAAPWPSSPPFSDKGHSTLGRHRKGSHLGPRAACHCPELSPPMSCRRSGCVPVAPVTIQTVLLVSSLQLGLQGAGAGPPCARTVLVSPAMTVMPNPATDHLPPSPTPSRSLALVCSGLIPVLQAQWPWEGSACHFVTHVVPEGSDQSCPAHVPLAGYQHLPTPILQSLPGPVGSLGTWPSPPPHGGLSTSSWVNPAAFMPTLGTPGPGSAPGGEGGTGCLGWEQPPFRPGAMWTSVMGPQSSVPWAQGPSGST